jgi:diguanylate cyclase (GGDEF)-like protein
VGRWPRSSANALVGALLAAGAPLGLLVARATQQGRFTAAWARQEVAAEVSTYAYVGLSTFVAFALFGRALGRQADRLYDLSRTDPLTRLRNRRAIEERLEAEFQRSLRYGAPLSALLVDLDGLKELNDRRGHRVGDQALAALAAAILRGSRLADVTARWGGDEFAILAPSTGRGEALRLAERVRTLAHEEAGSPELITVSIGVATLDAASRFMSPEALIRAADAALYEAKRTGRNRVVAG